MDWRNFVPDGAFLHQPFMEFAMLNLFVVASLLSAISMLVMSGAVVGSGPSLMELTGLVFAISAGVSTLAIAAIEG